jgi:hypothetical protein
LGFAGAEDGRFIFVEIRISFASDDKGSFDVVSFFSTVVLDFVMPVRAEVIEAEAVGLGVDDGKESGLEIDELGGIYLALEYGVLDALAEVEAGLGGAAEASFPSGCSGGDVVGDENVQWELGG